MYMIKITEEKVGKLSDHIEESLRHLGKAMQCVDEWMEEGGEMGHRGDYGMRNDYGMRGGQGGRYSGGSQGSYGNRGGYGMRDDEDWDEDWDEDEEPLFFEVTCPACENTITVDEDVVNLGAIQCPNCGEMLEFEFDEDDEEEDD